MQGLELNSQQRGKLINEVNEAKAVGAIPVASLIKIVEDWMFIVENYDL